MPSPYYKPTHLKWQKACRAFIAEHLLPFAMEWETEETVPEHVFETFGKANMLIPNLPAPLPVAWLKRLGIHDILGVVKVEEWDYLHMAIYFDEMSRCGLAGPPGSLTTGMSFGVPPMGQPPVSLDKTSFESNRPSTVHLLRRNQRGG